jgi:oligoendopeptidase F
MSAVTASALPRWDLTPFFPSLDSPEFDREFTSLRSRVGDLRQLFDRHGVAAGAALPADSGAFDEVVGAYNAFMERVRTLGAFVYAHTSTNSRDQLAAAKESELQLLQAELSKLRTRLDGWMGRMPTSDLVAASKVAADHELVLVKAQTLAKRQLSPSEEDLAADLAVTGSNAWSKLHSKVTSQITVEVGGKSLPMSAVRALAYDASAETRRLAYEAELAAWKQWETPVAACLNSIKGEVGLLAKRRGWGSPLEAALFHAHIDRGTLDAMMAAAQDSFPAFRRYLRAKAKAIGKEKLPFYDIFAPVGSSGRSWEYGEACAFVERHFRGYSGKMGDFAARSFRENWTDAEPRPGKGDGAYCMGVTGDVSRVMMNFKPAFGSVSTLAHELGHAYHNVCLAERTYLQRGTPMTLAETASIFCETICRRAALGEGSDAEKLEILEASLQGACQTVVDISSRFLFESAVFEKRSARELSADEFCAEMISAQRATYGDGLDTDLLHPYMWAVKPHYYSGRSFYNFPYMFGLLFGLGLYARYEASPSEFKAGYDDLLSSTGLADAATLASRFGIDIRTPDFWRASLQVVERDIEEFERLV